MRNQESLRSFDRLRSRSEIPDSRFQRQNRAGIPKLFLVRTEDVNSCQNRARIQFQTFFPTPQFLSPSPCFCYRERRSRLLLLRILPIISIPSAAFSSFVGVNGCTELTSGPRGTTSIRCYVGTKVNVPGK